MQMRADGTLVRPHALLQRFRNVRRGIDIFVQFRYLRVTNALSRRRDDARRTEYLLDDISRIDKVFHTIVLTTLRRFLRY